MRSFPTLLVLLALLVFAAPADAARKKPAKLKPVAGKLTAKVGIADQKPDMFTDPRFRGLGIKIARLSVGWDAMQYGWQVEEIDRWMAAAKRAGVAPVVTFARSRIGSRRHLKPSAAQVRKGFVAFRKRYPWVTEYVASNESNHYGEPTGRNPTLAAQWYKAMRSACPVKCKIAGATLLDQPNLVSWTKAFVKAAKGEPKYWALHNYVSANRFDDTRTRQLLQATRGEVWLTEVGGLVKRRTKDRAGKAKLKEGVAHAAQVTTYIFDRLARVSPRITRIYLYHWNAGDKTASWDSGLIAADGKERPAFRAFERFMDGPRTGAHGKAPKPGKGPAKGNGKAKGKG